MGTQKIIGDRVDTPTHVALLVFVPGSPQQEIKSPVETTQVAPTILSALGLNPQALQAVQLEKTTVLPGLSFEREN
jgi:arylsulfatase A-like enzyme